MAAVLHDLGAIVGEFDSLGVKSWPLRSVKENMALRALVILCGLAVAAWGHLLLGERRRACAAWRRLDDLFPPAWRSSEAVAGGFLLGLGAFFVLVAIAGA